MDIYTKPEKSTYVTGEFFVMPTDSGGIPAIAVSNRASVYITSTYTILMTLIFMIGWNLITAIIMAFWPTRGDPNRQVALVALWNSGESMNAMWLMMSYCKSATILLYDTRSGPPDPEERARTLNDTYKTKWRYGKSNLLWGVLFVLIAFATTIGNFAAGIFVPVQLSMGNVVPPAPGVIFYPNVEHFDRNDDNGAGRAKLSSLRAPSALRALGSIEASAVTVRKRVHLVSIPAPSDQLASLWTAWNYNYNVTGVDMGLQSDPKLTLKIKGICHTDYTWLANSTDQGDTYTLFGGDDTYTVKPQTEVDLPPMVDFFLNPKDTTAGSSNISYALIIKTAGRYSYTSGQDPWYATEPAGGNTTIAYRVQRGRPALSCWEDRRWRLGGNDVEFSKLTTLPGLKLAKLWGEKVFPLEFQFPRLVSLGQAAGSSALKSASYAVAPNYNLDAGASSIKYDLERLVLASWVSSRNVLRDTTTYPRDDVGIPNLLEAPGGGVDPSVAKFVLQSGDVVTFSKRILIAVPSLLVFLLFFQIGLKYTLRHWDLGQDPILDKEGNAYNKEKNASDKEKNPSGKNPSDKQKGAIALLATQLFRALNKKSDHSGPKSWRRERKHIPFLYPFESAGPAPENPTGAGPVPGAAPAPAHAGGS